MPGPNDPNLDIRIKVSGSPAGEQDLKRVAEATEKTNASVRQLSTGFQKLSGVMPGLAAAIRTLSSPYAALAAGIALATRKIQDFIAEVEKQVEAQRVSQLAREIDKVTTASNQAQTESAAFAESIRKITDAAPGAAAALAAVNDQIKLRFELMGKAGGKDIESRQRQAEITAIFNARNQARDQKEAALAQEPIAKAEADELSGKAAAMDADIVLLTQQAEEASKEEAAALDRAQGPFPMGDLDIFFRPKNTREKQTAIAEQARARKESILENIQRRTDQQALAKADAEAAQKRLSDIRARGTTAAATENKLTFELQGIRQQELIKQEFNPGPPGIGPGSPQFRFDAQLKGIRDRNVVQGIEGLGDEVLAALKSVMKEVRSLRQQMRSQSQADR